MIGQALRFVVVGGVNTATYYGFYLSMREWIGYLPGHVVAFVLSTIGSFFLNTLFTYRVRPTLRRFLLFPLSTVVNFVVTTVGVVVLVEYVGLGERVAPLFAAVMAIPVTFVVARRLLVGRARGEGLRRGEDQMITVFERRSRPQ
ncbi:GtrA family protein [Jiangella asiatica]|uniref:GtrA family protein n=1 Tax=Jiangella asiatica TaxID=2530372 RepID=A0A4R5DNJ4_9ACTN|nr:GtrA family protein [Jiangella asiatica]TDE15902.1 GtrA family protein [Jiangella asiatica]